MTFSKRPLRLGSGSRYHGRVKGDKLDLVFVLADNSLKLKTITQSAGGYQSTEKTLPVVANEGVIVGDQIISVFAHTITNIKI